MFLFEVLIEKHNYPVMLSRVQNAACVFIVPSIRNKIYYSSFQMFNFMRSTGLELEDKFGQATRKAGLFQENI